MKILEIKSLAIPEIKVIRFARFMDHRGYFTEPSRRSDIQSLDFFEGIDFLQVNESFSKAGTVRGLHFQSPPYSQDKLVRVVQGSVLDVVVDIRPNSTTYGEHFKIKLDSIQHHMMFVPKGMAHGFLSLEDDTIFTYKCTDYYHPETEGCILWNDSSLNIDWNVSNPIISDKDKLGETFKEFKSPF